MVYLNKLIEGRRYQTIAYGIDKNKLNREVTVVIGGIHYMMIQVHKDGEEYHKETLESIS